MFDPRAESAADTHMRLIDGLMQQGYSRTDAILMAILGMLTALADLKAEETQKVSKFDGPSHPRPENNMLDDMS